MKNDFTLRFYIHVSNFYDIEWVMCIIYFVVVENLLVFKLIMFWNTQRHLDICIILSITEPFSTFQAKPVVWNAISVLFSAHLNCILYYQSYVQCYGFPCGLRDICSEQGPKSSLNYLTIKFSERSSTYLHNYRLKE